MRRTTRKNPHLKGYRLSSIESKMSTNSSSTGRTPADNMVGGCEFESHLLEKLIISSSSSVG